MLFFAIKMARGLNIRGDWNRTLRRIYSTPIDRMVCVTVASDLESVAICHPDVHRE